MKDIHITTDPEAIMVEADEINVSIDFELATPGADYIWFDCTGETLE